MFYIWMYISIYCSAYTYIYINTIHIYYMYECIYVYIYTYIYQTCRPITPEFCFALYPDWKICFDIMGDQLRGPLKPFMSYAVVGLAYWFLTFYTFFYFMRLCVSIVQQIIIYNYNLLIFLFNIDLFEYLLILFYVVLFNKFAKPE